MSSPSADPMSIRLSARTLELLERRAHELRESRNALADRSWARRCASRITR
jgi:hypothetical protein